MRSRVPFSEIMGVLLLEFLVELIREALLRVPVQIGQAIGIMDDYHWSSRNLCGLFYPVLLILVTACIFCDAGLYAVKLLEFSNCL
jgi:hypothetical protein